MIKVKIQHYLEYAEEIKEKLQKEGFDLSLFDGKSANGIRDGPLGKEILRIQGEYPGKLYHYAFRQPEAYAELGYPEREISILIEKAKAQKTAVIKWIMENHLRLKKLKKELKNASAKGKKSKDKK